MSSPSSHFVASASTDSDVAGPPRAIVWLVQGDETFGVRRAVLTLTGAARDAGWRVVVASLTDGPFVAECRSIGFDVRVLNVGQSPGFYGGPLRKLASLWRLQKYAHDAANRLADAVRADRPNLLHVLWPNLISIAGQAAQRLGVPCIYEMVNTVTDRPPLQLGRRYYQHVCKRYRIRPLANSYHTARTFGDSPVKPGVMQLGADPDRFDPARVQPVSHEALNVPADAIVLAVLARLNPVKGQDRLVEAARRLTTETGEPLHVLLVGGGEAAFRQRIEAAAAGGFERNLHLVPSVPDPERYYGVVDVAVNWAIDPEPFGLSVVEAMMMEKPVLAYRAGGPGETVEDDVTGWLADDATVETLTATIRRALADRPRWAEMGRAGRRRAIRLFSVASQFATYRAEVDKLLAFRRDA